MRNSVRVSQLVRRRTRLLVEALDTQEHLKNEVREAGEHLERLERIGVIGQLSTIFAYEMRQPPGAILLYSLGLGKIAQNAEHVGNAENVGSVPATKILDVLDKLDRQTARADRAGKNAESIHVVVHGKGEKGVDIAYDVGPETFLEHDGIPVFGLYPNYTNKVTVTYKQDGKEVKDEYRDIAHKGRD